MDIWFSHCMAFCQHHLARALVWRSEAGVTIIGHLGSLHCVDSSPPFSLGNILFVSTEDSFDLDVLVHCLMILSVSILRCVSVSTTNCNICPTVLPSHIIVLQLVLLERKGGGMTMSQTQQRKTCCFVCCSRIII